MKTLALATALWLPLCPTLADAAATIYRCGPEGRVFSQTPCPDAVPMTPKVDMPDAGRLQQAQAVAARDMQLAERMARERHAREAETRRSMRSAAGFHTAPKPAKDKPAPAAAADPGAKKPKPRRGHG